MSKFANKIEDLFNLTFLGLSDQVQLYAQITLFSLKLTPDRDVVMDDLDMANSAQLAQVAKKGCWIEAKLE